MTGRPRDDRLRRELLSLVKMGVRRSRTCARRIGRPLPRTSTLLAELAAEGLLLRRRQDECDSPGRPEYVYSLTAAGELSLDGLL